MKHDDPITIALKHPANVKDGQRLIHTTVYIWCHHRKPQVQGDAFSANDDDRVQHKISDLGVTYLLGHVPFDSPEALELIRRAEEADALAAAEIYESCGPFFPRHGAAPAVVRETVKCDTCGDYYLPIAPGAGCPRCV